MKLSKKIVDQFVNILSTPKVEKNGDSEVYGTIRIQNGKRYIQLDGSNMLTPFYEAVGTNNGDRVTASIRNHQIIVTGNISAPATSDRQEVGNGIITIKQGTTVKGTFTTNQRDNLEVTMDEVPKKVSQLENDNEYQTRQMVDEKISFHNQHSLSHQDIRSLISGLTTRINAIADSDDITLDQLSEIVAYIKANRSLIDSITTSKVSVSDIVDNLISMDQNKPLSANMGRQLKADITAVDNAKPSKTGAGASGTWPINISGTADNVNYLNITNGNEVRFTNIDGLTDLWFNWKGRSGVSSTLLKQYNFGNGQGGTSGVTLVADAFSGSAAKVNGHTVNSDVPSGAKFTDTTYSLATQNANGLMSAADKKILDGLSGLGGLGYTLLVEGGATAGGSYLGTSADNVYTWSKSAQSFTLGLIIIFSGRNSDGQQNYGWSTHFVPKWVIARHNGQGHCFPMTITGSSGATLASQYLYVSNNQVKGHNTNDKYNVCLRYILGV